MNSAIKTGKIIARLQHIRSDIVFLQETHLKTTEFRCIKRPWMAHVLHSKYSERSRGAAIIIHKNVPFTLKQSIADPNGRFVIAIGTLHSIPVTLASIYAPNWDDPDFFHNFFSKIPRIDDHFLIIGGDFNLVQDAYLDRSSSIQPTHPKSADCLWGTALNLGLLTPGELLILRTGLTLFFPASTIHSQELIFF